MLEQLKLLSKWILPDRIRAPLKRYYLKKYAQKKRKFPPSKLANKYLKNLNGLEIGGSAHNPFYLKTKNVDLSADMNTLFKKEETDLCGEALKVDIEAPGDKLPVPDESQDFVVSSHVIEHFFDPIQTLQEWLRVVKPGGYVFVTAPHRDRTFDRDRSRTTLQELIGRHKGTIPQLSHDVHTHFSVWTAEDFLELCKYLNLDVVEYQDPDDKVGNGFSVVIKKL
jgi:SAM-dependent methyltransferase